MKKGQFTIKPRFKHTEPKAFFEIWKNSVMVHETNDLDKAMMYVNRKGQEMKKDDLTRKIEEYVERVKDIPLPDPNRKLKVSDEVMKKIDDYMKDK